MKPINSRRKQEDGQRAHSPAGFDELKYFFKCKTRKDEYRRKHEKEMTITVIHRRLAEDDVSEGDEKPEEK